VVGVGRLTADDTIDLKFVTRVGVGVRASGRLTIDDPSGDDPVTLRAVKEPSGVSAPRSKRSIGDHGVEESAVESVVWEIRTHVGESIGGS
jgi:hypothetical protein